jgi:hypothetical protein
MKNHIKLADFEIPKNIWTLNEDERKHIVSQVKTFMERLLFKELGVRVNRDEFLKKLIESSIIVNENEENYEICAILLDIKKEIENE